MLLSTAKSKKIAAGAAALCPQVVSLSRAINPKRPPGASQGLSAVSNIGAFCFNFVVSPNRKPPNRHNFAEKMFSA